MAHHPEEAAEVTEACKSLVCNFGATESFDAMLAAGTAAKKNGRPILFDPVGTAGSSWRRKKCYELIEAVRPDCIRGNYAEIMALAGDRTVAGGVDAPDLPGQAGRHEMIWRDMVRLAEQTGAVIIATGKTDLICEGTGGCQIKNGSGMMARITGAGCMLSALLGAALAVENTAAAAAGACAAFGICGELAEQRTRRANGGTMTFRGQLIDAAGMLEKEAVITRYRGGQFIS